MIVGIDGYCFHRWFGQAYPGLETDPGQRMSAGEVVDRVAALGARGIAIESFMLAPDEDVPALRRRIDAAGLTPMWAWGHPDGLGSGKTPWALADLERHVDLAVLAGARVIRICGGGRNTRPADFTTHREALLPLLHRAARYAGDRDVVLALENHIDFTSAEIVDVVEAVGSEHLGICLDTGNQLRMLEDPLEANRRMAPYAKACHVKDLRAHRGDPHTFAFWPSVPFGDGIIDFDDLFDALRAARFDGILAVEIDYLHPGYASLDEALALSVKRLSARVRQDDLPR